MALPARPMHVPAGLPIDEATRKEILDVGRANTANVNVRSNERGVLDKRLGFGSLAVTRSDASSRSAGRRLFAHKGVPTVIDGTHVDSYVEAATANATRSRIPECSYRSLSVPPAGASAVIYDSEYCNGFVAVASAEDAAGAAVMTVVDAATGATVRSPEKLGSAAIAVPYVGSFDSRYFVAVVLDSTTALTAYIFDTQAISTGWVSLATVAASSSAPPSICSLSNRVAIAYGTASGTDRVTVKTYDETGLLETRTIATSSVTPTIVSVDGSIAGTLWVAWNEVLAVKAIGIDADSMASTLATTATIVSAPLTVEWLGICEGSTSGTARVYVLDAIAPTVFKMAGVTTSVGAAVAGTATTVVNVTPRSRPFQQGGRYYMAFSAGDETDVGDSPQNLCIICDWSESVPYLRPVANIEPGLAAFPVTFGGKVSSGTTGQRVFAVQVVKSGLANVNNPLSATSTSGSTIVTLDFATRDRWLPVDHANSTFLGGAVTCVFDGNIVTEAGFLMRPNTVTTSAAGSGITGSFRYVAIFEDIDAAGNWVVSGISTPSDLRTVTDDTITVTTSPCPISMRCDKRVASASNESSVRVAWYRTATGGEPPYYRLGVTTYDLSAYAVTFADAVPDATLIANAKLYAPNLPGTAGESLDRRAPPGLTHLESYAGMLVGARGESLFFSGQEVYGEATWFSPVFEVPITGGGDITGLKAQDGALVIFKADRIFVLSGEAPSDNGLQGGLGVPRLIATDVGCVESNSIVATSLGVFFQSARGIEILSRAQTVEPIGEQVQDTLASFPVVTSAVLDTRHGLARFTLAAAEASGAVSGDGRTLVYDLPLKSWVSVDDVRGASASQSAQSAALCWLDGAWRYAWLSAAGVVYYERDAADADAYLDGTSFVTAQYELPPWKLGLQQEQRIYEVLFLFERHSAAGLTIEVAQDYGAYVGGDAKVWAEGVLASQRQVPYRPKPQTHAVQFRVKDTAPAVLGTGRGFSFIGLSADIALKQGATRGTTRLNPELRR